MCLAKETVQQLSQELYRHPHLLAAYLLGSAGTDHFRPDSDLDIALLPYPGHSLSGKDMLELAADLQDHFGYIMDIGLLSTRQLIYTKEAITQGHRLFCRDEYLHDLFVATALSLYAQLRLECREIEKVYAGE